MADPSTMTPEPSDGRITIDLSPEQARALLVVLDCVGGASKARMCLDDVRQRIERSIGAVAFGEYERAAELRVTTTPPLMTGWERKDAVHIYDANERGYTVEPEPGDWGYPAYAREMLARLEIDLVSTLTPSELAAAAYAKARREAL